MTTARCEGVLCNGIAAAAVTAILFLMAGCASSSIDGDVRRVRELTHVEAVERIAEAREVDPATSQDTTKLLAQPLDTNGAVRVALLNNRELAAKLREMGVYRGRLLQAGLLPNPVVEVEVLPERNSQLELRVEYDITKAVLAPLRSRAARPDLEASRFAAAGAVVELGFRVRAEMYRLLAAKQRLALAENVLAVAAASHEAAKAMAAAGNVPALDVASEEASYERGRIAVAKLELEVATEREAVNRLLGLHGTETDWKLAGELVAVPAAPTITKNLEKDVLVANLDLQAARHRLEGIARRAGVTRTAGWLPDITADIHGLEGHPDAVPMAGDTRDWRFGAGVSASVPIFDRRQGDTRSLEAEFDAAMERYYGMAIDLRSVTREARARVLSAHARGLQYQEVIVPAQKRVTEQTLLQYNAMQVGIFELLAARREQLDVELAYVDTLREYWTAVAELDALVAGKRVAATVSDGVATGERAVQGNMNAAGGH